MSPKLPNPPSFNIFLRISIITSTLIIHKHGSTFVTDGEDFEPHITLSSEIARFIFRDLSICSFFRHDFFS